MGRNARSKGKGTSCKGFGKRGGKTKTKTRDLDQIKGDLLKDVQSFIGENLESYYCVECARYFESAVNSLKHKQSKLHKRRLKKLKEEWPKDYGSY